jgi:hypothetical protein
MPRRESHRRDGPDHHVADDAAERGGDEGQEDGAERIETALHRPDAAAQSERKTADEIEQGQEHRFTYALMAATPPISLAVKVPAR